MRKLYDLLSADGIDVKKEHPLAPHSSFRVGGNARLAAFPKSLSELICVLRHARATAVRFSVFGNASNVVFPDGGFDGLVVFTGACRNVEIQDKTIISSCGASMTRVASLACENGLSGAEFMHGIPGTVGGGVYMNAGAFEGCIAQICTQTTYWNKTTGEISTFEGDAHNFGTRTSVYAQNDDYVLLEARFVLKEDDKTAIRARMDDFMARRKSSQPLEYPSAGSVFKRPVGHFAGKLIQDCGLKGYTIGGAQVSKKHAGFIINIGGATADDIDRLAEYVKNTVYAQTGVLLEREIQFVKES